MTDLLPTGPMQPADTVLPDGARRVINLRGWPGLEDWQAPSQPPVYTDRLAERAGLVVVAAARPGAVPESFGLGAYLEVIGPSVLTAGLIVPDDLVGSDTDGLRSWSETQWLETTAGHRSWTVVTLSAFCDPRRGPLARRAYARAGWCIGADLGRTFGLMADHCAPRRGRNAGSWQLWLPGWGTQHANGWKKASPHRPPLRLTPRRVGWQVEFAPCGTDAHGRALGKRIPDGRTWRGAFVDVLSLAYALDADRGASFAEHAQDLGLEPFELPVSVSVDQEGAARTVEAALAVHRLAVVLDEHAARWFTTGKDRAEQRGRVHLARTISPGAIAAQVAGRLQVRAPVETLALSSTEHDGWAEAFHGGWCDADVRTLGVPVPTVAADVSSCYPLVAHRLGWWPLVCAERVQRRNVTAALRRVCERAATDPTAAIDPAVWERFGFTLAEVVPAGEPFPIEVEDDHRPDGRMEVIPVFSPRRIFRVPWCDVVAAAVLSGRVPRIVRATRYVPIGRQPLRTRLDALPGLVLGSDDDPAVALARRRQRAKAAGEVTLAVELRVVVNALCFGNFVRSDELTRRAGRRWVLAERPGPWTCLPIAASVTAGARLLLAVLERLVSDRGGIVAYRDTDSSLLPATPEGGELALPNGSSVRALSWAEVDTILGAFAQLSPSPEWPVWKQQRGTPARPLHALVFGPKRHIEFTMSETGPSVAAGPGDKFDAEYEVVDFTEANLGGTYVDPPTLRGRCPDGRRAWSLAADQREVTYTLAHQRDRAGALRPDAPWDLDRPAPFPALRRYTVTTPEAARRLPAVLGARPGTRYVEASTALGHSHLSAVVALDPGGDLSGWQRLQWFDKATGTPVRVTTDPADIDARQLETLGSRAAEWSRPRRSVPIDAVVVDPLLVRRVGRVSGVIDADLDGLGDLVGRRPLHQEADQLAAVQAIAKANGPRAFARRTDLSIRVAERAALGRPISQVNVARALHALRTDDGSCLCACGCGIAFRPKRADHRFLSDAHRKRASRGANGKTMAS